MKGIFKAFLKYRMSIIFFLLFSYILSFFCIEYIYNTNYSYYTISFEGNNVDELFSIQYFDDTFDKINYHNNNLGPGEKKISYANIDYKQMLNDSHLEKNDNNYTFYVKLKYFPSINRTSNGIVNEGKMRVNSYFTLILSYSDQSYNVNYNNLVIGQANYLNSYLISLYISLGITIVYLITLGILAKLNKFKEIEDISDNINIYKTPFKLSYWKSARSFFKSIKNLNFIAMLFALMIICKFITLPSGFGSLGLNFTYLVFSIIAMLYGPLCGIVIGFFSDVIGYFMFPSTGFFFGYTFNAMLTGFIYGIFFYKTKITFAKCLYARLFVNLVVNVIFGTIWWSMIYSLSTEAAVVYLLTMALPKNLIYLIPQSLLLFLVIKYVLKPLRRFNIVDSRIIDNVSLI